jgi:hypothetical protein
MDFVVSDSLQATRDTLVLVQAQSTSWLEWVSLGVSVLIAGFTGGYLWYTMGIFKKTEEQADAAQNAAAASVGSNTIQKRAHFYPTFDMELRSHGMEFRSLVPTVISADDNAIVNSYLYVLVEYEKAEFSRGNFGRRIYANGDKHALLWGEGLGNITSEETRHIEAKRQIKSAHFLLRFSDALMNTYYRYQHFKIEPRDKKVAQPYSTKTTELNPTEEYTEHVVEDGIYFVPESDVLNNDGGRIRTREEAKEGKPEPVRVFSEKVYWKAAGGLGSLGQTLEARR